MKLKKWLLMLLPCIGSAVFLGCEWSAGGGVDSWDDSYNAVNFSGVYRRAGAGYLVSDYTGVGTVTEVVGNTSGGTGGSPSTSASRTQVFGIGASDVTISRTLSSIPIVPGSVSISVGSAFVLRDNGAGALVSGAGISGTIDYETGAWTIDYGSATVPPNSSITAAYRTYGGMGTGTTGLEIYTFTVHHEGQYLKITDNTGATYEGRMGSIRSSIGQDATSGAAIGGTIVAQFTATGTSKAGLPVNMAGTFQGEVLDSENATTPEYSGLNQKVFTNRKMIGTWIEDGGKTGDIVGDASPITIYSPGNPTATTDTTTTDQATEGTVIEETPAESTNL